MEAAGRLELLRQQVHFVLCTAVVLLEAGCRVTGLIADTAEELLAVARGPTRPPSCL